MEFNVLQKRALEIRSKFAEFEVKNTGKEWTNSQIMEGFVGDVGDLMKLVMAKEGAGTYDNVDEKLIHELSDCLHCIMVLASRYNIDLEKTFLDEMNKIESLLEDQ